MTEKDLEIQRMRQQLVQQSEQIVRLLDRNLELVKILQDITKDVAWLIDDITKAQGTIDKDKEARS